MVKKEQIHQVHLSIGRCLIKEKDFMKLFYDNFLNSHPDIAPMFANTDMDKQYTLLKQGLTFLIMSVGDSRFAKKEVEKLGVQHDREHLNIAPKFYSYWRDALLKAVKQFDKELNPSIEKDWADVLQEGITSMTKVYEGKKAS